MLGVRALDANANTDANELASAYKFSVVKFNEPSINIDAAHIPTRYGVLVTFSTKGIPGSTTVYIQLFAGGYGDLWFRHFSWSSFNPSEWVKLT